MADSGAPRRSLPLCVRCRVAPASVKRRGDGSKLCKECFFAVFEDEVHATIVSRRLFCQGQRVAIGASGGKDSTVLAYILKTLNERHNYGLELRLVSVDEGIAGYRDDSLETVKLNEKEYRIPLTTVSFEDHFGWSMDSIVKQTGLQRSCTFCGVFRRQALDRASAALRCDVIATGHNADDAAETILMNMLRGDIARLRSCVEPYSGLLRRSGVGIEPCPEGTIPRAKPLMFQHQKDVVMYAHFKKLRYFSTECFYAASSYRGEAREFLKRVELVRPQAIYDIIRSAEDVSFACRHAANTDPRKDAGLRGAVALKACVRCGYVSSQTLCRACSLIDHLNTGTHRSDVRMDHSTAHRPTKGAAVQSARVPAPVTGSGHSFPTAHPGADSCEAMRGTDIEDIGGDSTHHAFTETVSSADPVTPSAERPRCVDPKHASAPAIPRRGQKLPNADEDVSELPAVGHLFIT